MDGTSCIEKTGTARWLAQPGVAETIACALAFLVYIPTLAFQFVYDDKPQIIENPAIHAWRYWPHYFTTHAWGELYPNVQGNYYRPLFLLWFRLNHALFGIRPAGWHLTNILCHVAVTYLVFVLIRRLTASRETAFISSVLFAVHPIHIESVAWVSGVSDPLAVVFLLGSFLAFLRARDEARVSWLALALALFAAALLEKETSIVLGPLVFLYAWLNSEKPGWTARFFDAMKPALGYLLITLAYLFLRAHVLHGLSHTVTPLSLTTILLTEPSVAWLYLRHLILPSGISGLYGMPYVNRPGSEAFWMPAALIAITFAMAALWISRMKDSKLAFFALCWMVIPVLPVLWFPAYSEGDIAHDRYLYFPSIGFVLLIALLIAQWDVSRSGTWKFAATAILAAAYVAGTLIQETYWASDLQLYQRAYSIAPRDNLIATNMATALLDSGEPGAAVSLYQRVLAREPAYWLANYDLGYADYKLGNPQAGEFYLRRALDINGNDSDNLIYLGLCIWKQGRTAEAIPYIRRAIAARPSASGYHFALAMILRGDGNLTGAEEEFRQEIFYHPDSALARRQLDDLHPAAPASK